ncbi:hypothetical protein BC943DRAFT_321029 [Umbelopsis sp. AD052]|nr:hypothetical protein BC943DRAFT_321029 [Umbelopsis sp. AD052]
MLGIIAGAKANLTEASVQCITCKIRKIMDITAIFALVVGDKFISTYVVAVKTQHWLLLFPNHWKFSCQGTLAFGTGINPTLPKTHYLLLFCRSIKDANPALLPSFQCRPSCRLISVSTVGAQAHLYIYIYILLGDGVITCGARRRSLDRIGEHQPRQDQQTEKKIEAVATHSSLVNVSGSG